MKAFVMEKWIAIYGVTAIIIGVIAALIAHRKDRNANSWFTTGFLFPPALIVLLFLGKSKTGPYIPKDDDDEDLRQLWSD